MDTAFRALAEPRRREILRLVWTEELPAAQIAARFDDVTRSAVSQHLGVLREAELVIERRDGTRRLYRANHAQMDQLRRFLDVRRAPRAEKFVAAAKRSRAQTQHRYLQTRASQSSKFHETVDAAPRGTMRTKREKPAEK